MEFSIGKVQVRSRFLNHPGICAGYRLDTTNASIAYLPDNEPYDMSRSHRPKADNSESGKDRTYAVKERERLVDFIREVDALVIDAQYTDDEYEHKKGWGHGSLSSVVSLALDADVRRLFLFHHDPAHDDKKLDEIVEAARTLVLESGKVVDVDAAREGTEVWLGARIRA
jgi:phosphoribosyl 1,2-cyclic phosphodiesterase